MTTITNTQNLVDELVATVLAGRGMEAFERFYADDVTMQENTDAPTVGKAANREREQGFMAMIAEVHEVTARSATASGNQSAIHWVIDFTANDGRRFRFDEVALQTWRDGRIVAERFIYDTATLVLAA